MNNAVGSAAGSAVRGGTGTALTVGVLGPTLVRRHGADVAVGGPAPRTVLCRLVVARGRYVSIDALVDCLWPHEPPPSARITAQGYLSVLRRALEPDRPPRAPGRLLVRDGTGYALRLEPGTLDADRFAAALHRGRDLLDGGDPRAALACLDEALTLWRGPAYADCADRVFVLAEAHRLRELRTAATEHRLAALIELGAHETAAAQLRAFLAAHPLRERAWALLARALYLAGRQGDALTVLRDARHRLMAELGVEPGAELAGLHHEILDRGPGDAPAGNLPHAVSALVGRDTQVRAVEGLLRRHRLVTLTGAVGMGKTRLALAVAAGRADTDGPWFADLAGVREPAALAGRVCAALGIAGPAGTGSLVAALRNRRLLLVVDDCQHAAAGELVSALLNACPQVRVLATGREPLRVGGEQRFEVPPLPAGEAVELFTARAAAVLSGWSPGAGERPLIARICAALDGMPLAIELAAAQIRMLSPRQLLQHLDEDRFAVLTGARTTLLELMDAWYERLTGTEQRLLQALAVFDGGFGLAAATAVAGPGGVLADLTALVDKSLVTVVAGAGERRFALLATVRQYAVRRTPAGRRQALGERHTAWLAQAAGPPRASCGS
ncbi:AfsR/SARP family transcriptional regulator [Dactylosporangium aurantiacum]|uniref:AfsR/SARP family transcriptional regulator n=1 Tax=Dactylosporangium aurantiacum TaxID=35754 RepID=A0A9Q9MQQ7_9ACTN|nr:BTAD domain-containing putative transcriptional regulator [Dactylosporangium aurantiacum]MDG6103308.1 BTAD domain-containing putative transcriptional regulator [Dactylosporangium aurantiacum]UWZ57807.1 AfsR/SARP family transcriptional regulator [Dactylosporangium aurantiacum]